MVVFNKLFFNSNVIFSSFLTKASFVIHFSGLTFYFTGGRRTNKQNPGVLILLELIAHIFFCMPYRFEGGILEQEVCSMTPIKIKS